MNIPLGPLLVKDPMPTLLTPDVLALVNANFGAALRAQIGHLSCAGSRPCAVAVAWGCGVAVAVHFLVLMCCSFKNSKIWGEHPT